MRIAVLTVTLRAPWVHSLKEKRMEVRSLLARARNQFNVSAAESGAQDLHQTIELSFAAIAGNSAQADSILGHLLDFISGNTQAEIVNTQREIY